MCYVENCHIIGERFVARLMRSKNYGDGRLVIGLELTSAWSGQGLLQLYDVLFQQRTLLNNLER